MKEEMRDIRQTNSDRLKTRLKIDKYDYIPAEFERSRNAK
jgi:hypothetical protein